MYDLGVLYDEGLGVKQNHAQAAQFYEKSCHGNYASGCYNLGVSYENGEGVQPNKSTAKKYYGKACDLGYQKGCDNYRTIK